MSRRAVGEVVLVDTPTASETTGSSCRLGRARLRFPWSRRTKMFRSSLRWKGSPLKSLRSSRFLLLELRRVGLAHERRRRGQDAVHADASVHERVGVAPYRPEEGEIRIGERVEALYLGRAQHDGEGTQVLFELLGGAGPDERARHARPPANPGQGHAGGRGAG